MALCDSYKISTQTFVVYAEYKNNNFDLDTAFNEVELHTAILGAKYGFDRKGDLEKSGTRSKNYLKCMTLSVFSVDKRMSVKIFKNGSIQITGCKNVEHVLSCVDTIYTLFRFENVDEIYLVSVMMNANFEGSFRINREKLGYYLIEKRGMNIPPFSIGCMGIKIKIPVFSGSQLKIPKYSWCKRKGFSELGCVSYSDYFSNDPKKRDKTFSACVGIFTNGKVLVSSVNRDAIDVAHEWVNELFSESRDEIEIKPKPVKTFIRD